MSSDTLLVNDKLRKTNKQKNNIKTNKNSSAPSPLFPLLFTAEADAQNALFLPPSSDFYLF